MGLRQDAILLLIATMRLFHFRCRGNRNTNTPPGSSNSGLMMFSAINYGINALERVSPNSSQRFHAKL